ncbi:hypothetical protein BC937DRAFT_95102, partial [Endogone sp. FLAS-F59071]
MPTDQVVSLGPDQLVPHLLAELDTSEGLPADFLSEMVARFEKEDDNALGQIFGPALTGLSAKIRGENILSEYRPALKALTLLTELKPLAGM